MKSLLRSILAIGGRRVAAPLGCGCTIAALTALCLLIPVSSGLADTLLSTVGGSAISAEDQPVAAAEEAAQAFRGSAAGAQEVSRSQGAYRDMDAGEAQGLLAAKFPALADAHAVAPLSAIPQGSPASFDGEDAAVVRTPSGDSELAQSLGLPLWVSSSQGGHAPLDLSLAESPAGFHPASPLVSAALPKTSGEGIAIGSQGLQISAGGGSSDVAGVLSGRRVFYGGAAGIDTDLLAEPSVFGASILFQIRSAAAPEQFSLRFALPAGAALQADGLGVDVVREGQLLGSLQAPHAQDAQGQPVPVIYEVSGTEVTVRVSHRTGSFAYPIVVDPVYDDWWDSGAAWSSGNPAGLEDWSTSTNGPFGFTTSGSYGTGGRGLYVEEPANTAFTGGTLGEWYFNAWVRHGQSTYIPETDFYNMIGNFNGGPHDGVINVGLSSTVTGQVVENVPEESNNYPVAINQGVVGGQPGTNQSYFELYEPTSGAWPTWEDAYLGGAVVVLTDNDVPTISGSQYENLGSWYPAGTTISTYMTSRSTGLGIQNYEVYGPNSYHQAFGYVNAGHSSACAGTEADACPGEWGSLFSLNTSQMAEGSNAFTAYSNEPGGHQSIAATWAVKVDKAPPAITLSGPAEEANGKDVGDALYGLNIEAKDATSGVKSIEVQVDGKQVLVQTETCTAESCPKTATDDEWVLQGQSYALGEHTITVRATDAAGNVTTQTIKVTVVATGQTGWYGLQEQALGEGVTTSVNPAGGNFMVESEDLPAEAATDEVALDRYYNSQAAPTGGTLGPRWSWSAGPDVFLRISTSTAVLHGANGYIVTLTRQTNGTYSAPAEFEGTLTKNENGTYTLIDEAGPTYQFNSSGVMTGYTDEEARTFTLTDATVDA
jgi:Domain of unknown function (DUF6531)